MIVQQVTGYLQHTPECQAFGNATGTCGNPHPRHPKTTCWAQAGHGGDHYNGSYEWSTGTCTCGRDDAAALLASLVVRVQERERVQQVIQKRIEKWRKEAEAVAVWSHGQSESAGALLVCASELETDLAALTAHEEEP